ncbi:MAG: GNAT family N-acetyltransferase [Ferruginibacter sp.]
MLSTITTYRLLLDPLISNDAEFIYRLVNSAGWLKYIGDRKINSLEDAAAYIKRICSNSKVTYWVVKLKENGNAIGIVTFIKRDYLDYPDIGFAFLPEFANQGYAFEATKKVLDILTGAGQKQILATTIPGNTNSIRLLEKLGLRLDKEIEVEAERLQVYKMTVADQT